MLVDVHDALRAGLTTPQSDVAVAQMMLAKRPLNAAELQLFGASPLGATETTVLRWLRRVESDRPMLADQARAALNALPPERRAAAYPRIEAMLVAETSLWSSDAEIAKKVALTK